MADRGILRKIIISVFTRCHILKLKCTTIDFGWGFASDPARGAYVAPPDLLLRKRRGEKKGEEAEK